MKTAIVVALLASVTAATAEPRKTRVAVMCTSAGEESSGMSKICYYDCMGSRAAITVVIASLCPLTINR